MVRDGRRRFLGTVAAGGMVATAGCSLPILGDGDGDGEDEQQGATDWPMVRGTAGATARSLSGGPSSEATPGVTAEFRNGFHARAVAPLIGDDGIYGVGRVAEPYNMDPYTFGGYAYKFSREDGSEEWRTPVEIREGGENVEFMPQSPRACLGSEGLYVCWVEKGQERYTLHLESRSRSDGSLQWEEAVDQVNTTLQPVVYENTVYVIGARRLHAFATADGTKRWQTDEFLYSQQAPSIGENVAAVFNLGAPDDDDNETRVTAFDLEDGSERWSERFPRTRGFQQVPTVADDTVFVAEGFGLGPLGAIFEDIPERSVRALSAEDGSDRWSYTYMDASDHPAMAGGATSVTVDEDTVYAGLLYPTARQALGSEPDPEAMEEFEKRTYKGENLVAIDRSDGTLKWETQVGTYAQVWSYLAVDDDNVYAKYLENAASEADGTVRYYVVDKDSGDVAGSFASGADLDTRAAFAVADGALFEHRSGSVHVFE